MIFRTVDFNKADEQIQNNYAVQWSELSSLIESMPLHLKASDQAGLQGAAIFDPVGTNAYIKEKLIALAGWSANKSIPDQFDFLGKDIDFISKGMLVEVQFSNYPFLLNNLIRSELFFHSKTVFDIDPTKVLIIITKAHMFPASNSTLYFEQAEKQLSALSKFSVFDIPIRLVGLFEESDKTTDSLWTGYHDPRYSRTVVDQVKKTVYISAPVPHGKKIRRSVITEAQE